MGMGLIAPAITKNCIAGADRKNNVYIIAYKNQ